MYQISVERPCESAEVEHLLDDAFGVDRGSKISYRYRDDVAPVAALGMVARDAEGLVGTIRYWPVAIGDAGVPALLLGPLAVRRDRNGEGIGAALMRRSLDRAVDAGHRLVVLVGDLAYYRRFGFVPAEPQGVHMPGEAPGRLLVKALGEGALDGVAGAVLPGRSTRRASRRPRPLQAAANSLAR